MNDEVHDSRAKSLVPTATADYLRPEYWDKRFQTEEAYDWFKGFEDFKHLVLPHLKLSDRILVLGCGNSTLTADLWSGGFHHITSVDLSEVVISKMRAKTRAAGMTSLTWQVADILDLPFSNATFDVVLEKGTLDVLFVDSKSSWHPEPEALARAHTMLAEAHRVLSAEGCFLSISFAQPHFRKPLFLAPHYSWGMQHAHFGETFHYFVYVLRKGSRSSSEAGEQTTYSQSLADYECEPMAHEHMDKEDYLSHIDMWSD